jgi:uncharacterized protein YbjT (DUF2867 family)
MIIALAGTSGLTGSHTLKLLLENHQVSKVISIGRKKIEIKHPKLEEVLLGSPISFRADAFLCCLGTTIKKAGSQEAFEKIDVQLPLELGRALKASGCGTAAVISAIGANSHSSVFYNRAKGKMEEGMRRIGFKSLSILRPSIIAGDRKESRIAEKISLKMMKAAAPLMTGSIRKFRPIEAETIAKALVKLALQQKSGAIVYESDAIQEIGS